MQLLLLKDIIEGKIGQGIDVTPRRRRKQLGNNKTLEIERGRTRSHSRELRKAGANGPVVKQTTQHHLRNVCQLFFGRNNATGQAFGQTSTCNAGV